MTEWSKAHCVVDSLGSFPGEIISVNIIWSKQRLAKMGVAQ